MDRKRAWHMFRLYLLTSGGKRAEYLRTHSVFKSFGQNCIYMPRKLPLYANLIKIGNYVDIASNVAFHTHDGIHEVLGKDSNMLPDNLKGIGLQEGIGCIEIGNHVFIGARAVIEYNVKIGDNVIITSGSIVTNDIPSNSVVRGNPAKVICSMSQLIAMKAAKKSFPLSIEYQTGKYVYKELEDWLWHDFYESRKKG